MRKIKLMIAACLLSVLANVGTFSLTAEETYAEAVSSTLMPVSYDMNSAMPYINQTDAPYAYVKIPALSGDNSVCSRGCGIVTYSMIEAYYQRIDNTASSRKYKLLNDVANHVYTSDTQPGNAVKTSVFSSLASRYGRSSQTVDVSKNSTACKSASKNNIHYMTTEQKVRSIEALGMGYPIANPTHGKFSLVGGGHYMVWSGIDINGKVYIHNANGKYSGQAFSISELDSLSNGNCTIVYPDKNALKLDDFSIVYDYNYYVNHNPKIKNAFGSGSEEDQIKAAAHFFTTGIGEGLQASPYFNIDDYIAENPDVKEYFNGDRELCFRHYCFFGFGEGRKCISSDHATIFDPDFYAEKYPSVNEACGGNASKLLKHFLTHGMEWIMQGSENFDPQTYILNYQDLRIEYEDDWPAYYQHYLDYGMAEGRVATGTPDFHPITTYQGIDYSAVYDFNYYYQNNEDLQKAYNWRNDYGVLKHFVTDGMKQGRQANENFNLQKYIQNHPELTNIYGDNYPSIYLHYIWWGKAAGWKAS